MCLRVLLGNPLRPSVGWKAKRGCELRRVSLVVQSDYPHNLRRLLDVDASQSHRYTCIAVHSIEYIIAEIATGTLSALSPWIISS